MAYKTDCPSWLCNEWGVPHDIYYALTILLLLLPYFWLWAKYCKSYRASFPSTLGFWTLALLTEFSAMAYMGLVSLVAKSFNLHFVVITCFTPIIITGFLLLPTGIIVILVSIFGNKGQ